MLYFYDDEIHTRLVSLSVVSSTCGSVSVCTLRYGSLVGMRGSASI